MSLTTLVASPGYFHGQVAAEFVHFLLINKMRVAANYAQSGTSSLSVWPANLGPPTQAPILWSSQSLRLPWPRDELILGDHVSSRLRAPHPAAPRSANLRPLLSTGFAKQFRHLGDIRRIRRASSRVSSLSADTANYGAPYFGWPMPCECVQASANSLIKVSMVASILAVICSCGS